jgi:hypothetical protein
MRTVAFGNHHFDDEQATIRLHRRAAIGQDLEAEVFFPIINDVRQEVCVGSGRRAIALRLSL